MKSHILWRAALSCGLASAFQDASPFFLFSTSSLANTSLDSLKIASSSQVTELLLKALEPCSSQTYLLVEQAGVQAADFVRREAVPILGRQVLREDEKVISSYTVQEVSGNFDAKRISDYLSVHCNAYVKGLEDSSTGQADQPSTVISYKVPALPLTPKERAARRRQDDDVLSRVIDQASSRGDYTVIYITTPPSSESSHAGPHTQQVYEMDELDFANAEHIELKRDFAFHSRDEGNPRRPLFETYQFLSPGLFMGGTVSLVLLVILYVGVRAIAGLEVSYMAFSKEMGPAAQKKQA